MPSPAAIVRVALLAVVAPRVVAAAEVAERAQGSVVFVTSARAYLNRGAADGLARGAKIQLVRRGARVAECALDAVSDHAAACPTTAARPGDAFAAAARPAPAARERGVTLPPPTDAALEQDRALRVAQAAVPLVQFQPRPRQVSGGFAEVTLGTAAWFGGGTSAATELDVRLAHVPMGVGDLRLDLSLSAVRWHPQLEYERFRPGAVTQLYLWEAEVSRRELDSRTVFAFGRLWPWHVPGVAVLDGVQVGRRNEPRTVEIGVYGGLLPSQTSLAPTAQWTAGAYAGLEQPGARGDVVRFARQELRLGVRQSPSIGDVREAEALGELTTRFLSVGAGGRLRHAPAVDTQPVLELAYATLQLRPGRFGGGWAQLRQLGVAPEIAPLLVDETPALLGGLHATVTGWVNLRTNLALGATGRWHLDRDTDRRELDASFDVQLPRLFGDRGGLWLSAFGAEGWLRTRGAAVQFAGGSARLLRLVARLDAAATQVSPTDATNDGVGLTSTELGAYLHLEARLARTLRLRARSRLRAPLAGTEPTPPRAWAAVGGLELVATF